MKRQALLFVITLILNTSSMAGNACEKRIPTPRLYQHASHSALNAAKTLDAFDPKVALIARVGSDLSQYGLRYSHVGFVVKNYNKKPGKWTVVHLLNQCGTDASSIYTQGLMNYFMDNLYSFDYQIIIPDKSTQAKIYEVLDASQLKDLHGKHYSMLAYPFSSRYQNSNQWVLEVLAKSISPKPIHSRTEAQTYLRKTGYKPSVIKLDDFSKLKASMFTKHIRFDDHPRQEMQFNQYSTVTVISVTNYLQKRALLLKTLHGRG